VQEYRAAVAEVERLEAVIAEARTPTELHIAEREGKIESAKEKIAELTDAKERLSEAEADAHVALSFFHHMCKPGHEKMQALNAAVLDAQAKRYAAAHAKAEKIRSMAEELVERLNALPDQTVEADLLTPGSVSASTYTNRPAAEIRQHISTLEDLSERYAVKEAVTA
jgi:DNA repair exonuclease SbcCD ATPase subunit